MTTFSLSVAVALVLAAAASYAYTRRFGTRRNVRLVYPLIFSVLMVESILNVTFPQWHLDDWCLRPIMLLGIALVGGSLLTWRRINRRGNTWTQIIALRKRNEVAGCP